MGRKRKDLEEEILALTRTRSDLEEELNKFRGLYTLALALTSDRSMDDILRLIVDQCRELLRADMSYIALQDESRGEFFKHTSAGIRTEAFKQMRVPYGLGLAAQVLESGQGRLVADYLAETALSPELREIAAAEGLISGMAAPVRMASRNLGVLYVFNRTRTVFSRSDLQTLTLIGNLAAVEISRKQAERYLRESEERFRFMAETTGDVIYRLRYESMTYDYISPGITNLTGYTAEEINALGFSHLVTRIDLPNEEDVSPEMIAEARLEGKIEEYRADYFIRKRSGELRWLRDHSFPWCDELGQLVGSVGILSDISAYKRAEALVRERTAELISSEEKYRTLVENVPLVVYRLKTNGEILFVNQFVEEVFGFSPVEILSSPGLWTETITDEDRERVLAQREESYRKQTELITEYRIKHKRGHVIYVMDHAIPLQAPGGTMGVVDGIMVDITWMVRLHEQLVRAEGLKTISEVSARLAHEIRNPLVSAGGFARRLLLTMGAGDPNRATVEIIVKEVGRLEAILRMLLNYLRPLELMTSPTNLNDLVVATLKALGRALESREVRLNVQLAPHLAEIPLDQQLLAQAVETLVRNALSHIPRGEGLTLVTLQEADLITVSMRYPVEHFSADDVEHFFYPFTASRTPDDDLDLPMSKIIVSKHGGAISVGLEPSGELLIRMAFPIRGDHAQNVLLP